MRNRFYPIRTKPISFSTGKKVYRAQTRFILLYQPRRHRKLRKMLVSELQVFIRMQKFNRPKTGREQMSGTSNSHTPIVGRMVLTAMDAMFIYPAMKMRF